MGGGVRIGGGYGGGGGAVGGAFIDRILFYASDLATLRSLPERFVVMEVYGVMERDANEVCYVF